MTSFSEKFCDMDEKHRRLSILNLYRNGITSKQEISEYLDLPLSTVYRVIKRNETGEGFERRKGSGREQIWQGRDRRRLGQIVKNNAFKGASAIRKEMLERGSPAVSTRTVQRQLARQHWVKKRGIPTPKLTERQKQARITWCTNHTNYDWSKVVFSDECSVWVYPNNITMWTKDTTKPEYPRPKHSPKFHLWGGFSSRGVMPLCVFSENLDKELYTTILEGHLLPTTQVLFPDGFVLQQDNDPKHTAKHTKAWFRDENVTVLDWPSSSPDLNPIENIWGLLKDHLNKNCPRDLDALKAECINFWNNLTHDQLQIFVESMPRRLNACLAVQGAVTKY